MVLVILSFWYVFLRDNRANAINRDVPSFLLYPDGSHSLGVISAPANNPGVGAEDTSSQQDSTITGPFVVWADPVPCSVRRGGWDDHKNSMILLPMLPYS